MIAIILTSNALSGCAKEENKTSTQIKMSELGMARIEAATELKKTVTLGMKEVSRKGNQVELQLLLHNPQHLPLTSVEAWLAYNPKHLQGLNFKPNEKDFELTAPYLNGFDANRGLVKLGRSTAEPISAEKIVLADFSFKLDGNDLATLEAFDYQLDISGHTSVNVMKDKIPVNMLLKPASPLFVVQK